MAKMKNNTDKNNIGKTAAQAKVSLFLLGGTISMDKAHQEDQGVVPRLDAQMLCAAVPGLEQVASIDAKTHKMIPSANLTFEDAITLAKQVEEMAASGKADGFVIIQGTDTLEEMAFLLDNLLNIAAPVVVTGAMRNPTALSADGPANIMAAVRCAASEGLAGSGVMVVMNDEIHSARFVKKAHTASLAAFISPNMGPIGYVVEDRVRLLCRPLRPMERFDIAGKVAEVALVKAAFGTQGYLLGLIEKDPPQALVIEAFGAGHVPEKILPALSRLSARIPVVFTSRAGVGRAFCQTYAYEGGEMDLINRGLIPAGYLDGQKARILLSLLLMSGADNKAIAAAFARWDFTA